MKPLPSLLLPSSTEANPSQSHLDITRCYLTLGYYSNLKCTVIYFQSLFNAQGNVLGPLAGVNIFMQAIISFKTFAGSQAAFAASFSAPLETLPQQSPPGAAPLLWGHRGSLPSPWLCRDTGTLQGAVGCSPPCPLLVLGCGSIVLVLLGSASVPLLLPPRSWPTAHPALPPPGLI